MGRSEPLVGELEEEAGLADRAVANNDVLKDVGVPKGLLCHRRFYIQLNVKNLQKQSI